MTNHLRKAGQEVTKERVNATQSAAQGDLASAAQSAWQGVNKATQEVWRSLRKNTSNAGQRKPRNK